MENDKIRQLVREEIGNINGDSQFNVSATNYHTHNGLDSQKINSKNLVYNDKVLAGLVVSNETTQFTLNLGIQNPTSIKLSGIARNVLSGTPTIKSSIVGFAELGVCYNQTSFNTQSDAQDIVQMCTVTEFDNTTGTWLPFVITAGNYIAAADITGSTANYAYLQVLSYTNNSITFLGHADADWSIAVNLIIT